MDSVPVKCIEVEARDGLYLTSRSYITTHNSTLTAGVALYCLNCEGEVGPQVIIGASPKVEGFVPAGQQWSLASLPVIGVQFTIEERE